MPIFPLPFRPKASYKESPRCFGSARDGGKRKHGGVDLYSPAGTHVLAVADGRVILGPYLFYDGVYAIEVEHPGIGIVRYGEISNVGSSGLHPGSLVKAGMKIGTVGKMQTVAQSMLHFEMFSGNDDGPLTDRNHPPYLRRSDLIDPTAFLDSCTLFQEPATPSGT